MSIEAFVQHALPATLRLAADLTRAIELTRGAVWPGAPTVVARPVIARSGVAGSGISRRATR